MNKRSKIFKQTSISNIETSFHVFFSTFCFLSSAGNGLIDETEFLQWIAKIQALRDTETSAEGDDLTQDLVAAFR